MAESGTLLNNEKSFDAENPVSLSNRGSFEREVLSKMTDAETESRLDITDGHALFENPFTLHETDTPFTPLESSIFRKNSVKNQENVYDFNDTGLELEIPSTIDPDVQDLLVEVSETYRWTHEFFIELESQSKNDFIEILQREDILYHITTALTEHSGNKENQLITLNLAKKRLEKVIIEAIDKFVEETSGLVSKYLKKSPGYYKLTFLSPPDGKRMRRCLKKVDFHLQMGHQLKGTNWDFSLREFNSAYIKASDLRAQIPDSNEIRHRLFGFLSFLFSLIALAVSIAMVIMSLLA